MYVYSHGSVEVSDNAHVELDPNLFLIARYDLEALELIYNSTYAVGGFERNHLHVQQIYDPILWSSAPKYLSGYVNGGW